MCKRSTESVVEVYRIKGLNHGKDTYFECDENEVFSDQLSTVVSECGCELLACTNTYITIRWDGNVHKFKLERVY